MNHGTKHGWTLVLWRPGDRKAAGWIYATGPPPTSAAVPLAKPPPAFARQAVNTPPQRILIIRPSALGDVCRSVPVLASLRRAYPEAEIDWLVQDTFAPAIEHHAALTGVI